MTNPVGRPNERYSRRKYAEAVRALKFILKSDKQPATIRLRACELLLLCYGVDFPDSDSKRNRRSAKELVQEHNLEQTIQKSIEARLAERDAQELLEADTNGTRAVFDAVLSGDGHYGD